MLQRNKTSMSQIRQIFLLLMISYCYQVRGNSSINLPVTEKVNDVNRLNYGLYFKFAGYVKAHSGQWTHTWLIKLDAHGENSDPNYNYFQRQAGTQQVACKEYLRNKQPTTTLSRNQRSVRTENETILHREERVVQDDNNNTTVLPTTRDRTQEEQIIENFMMWADELDNASITIKRMDDIRGLIQRTAYSIFQGQTSFISARWYNSLVDVSQNMRTRNGTVMSNNTNSFRQVTLQMMETLHGWTTPPTTPRTRPTAAEKNVVEKVNEGPRVSGTVTDRDQARWYSNHAINIRNQSGTRTQRNPRE